MTQTAQIADPAANPEQAAQQQIPLDPTYVQALVDSLQRQRNSALDANVQLTAQLAATQAQLKQAVALLHQHGLVKVVDQNGNEIPVAGAPNEGTPPADPLAADANTSNSAAKSGSKPTARKTRGG